MNPDKLTKVTVEVTAAHIKNGKINHVAGCPFALALKKVLRKNVDVSADYDIITLTVLGTYQQDVEYNGLFLEIKTPARVSKFMGKIDARDPDLITPEYDAEGKEIPIEFPPAPKPFSINLKIPNRFLRKGLQA